MKAIKLFALCVLLGLLCACGGGQDELQKADNAIKIGVYLPLTGPNAYGGQLELEGILLAHKHMGEVLGRPVELVVEDNKSDRATAAEVVRKLIEEDKVTAIVGTYGSSLALAGGEVSEKAGIPVMGTSCTNPKVTVGKRAYFRACFIDPFQGAAAAAYAYCELGLRRGAVIFDQTSEYSAGLTGYFIRSFLDQGGTIVAIENYLPGNTDFEEQLTAIAKADPDILFMPAYFNEGVQILMQARAQGAKYRIMGGDAMDNPTTTSLVREAIEGFMHTTFPYDPNMPDMTPEARKFTEEWLAAYNKEPSANAAAGYNAYQLMLEGIRRAGSTDASAIGQALAGIKNLPGVLGPVSITNLHDAEMPVGIIEYKDNRRVFLGVTDPMATGGSALENAAP